MNRRLKYFLFIVFLSQVAVAQQDTVVVDSVAEDYDTYFEESIPEEEERKFLTVTGEPDTLQLRTIPDSVVSEIKNDNAFWYADAIPNRQKPKRNSSASFVSARWFQTLLWVLIIAGFAGFIIWYLAGSNVGLFKKKRQLINDPSVEEELSTDDLFAINYQREIDKAVGQGNYRLAIRLMFLRLLKNLSERNIIEYRQGRTNFDYLVQLQPTRHYPDFFRITRNYEYSWYGQFEVGEEKFRIIRKEFEQFETRM